MSIVLQQRQEQLYQYSVMFRLLFILLLLPQLLFATDYYVNCNSGNDTTGDGTSGTPWATVQKCVDNSSGGDTCFIAETCNLSTPVTWGSFGGGTSQIAPFIIAGWDDGQADNVTPASCYKSGACVAGAVLDGGGTTDSPFSASSDPHFMRYKDIRFTDFDNRWTIAAYWKIIDCEFDTWSSPSDIFRDGNLGLFYNNYIHDVSGTNGYTFLWGGGVHVVGNVIESDDCISLTSNECIFANNVFKITDSSALCGIYNQDPYNIYFGNTLVGLGTANMELFNIGNNTADIMDVFDNVITDWDIFADDAGIAYFGYVGGNSLHDTTYDYSGTGIDFIIDDTADDVTDSTFPLVSSTDYNLTSGTNAEDASVQPEGGLKDIGAVESTASGGGAATTACGFVN